MTSSTSSTGRQGEIDPTAVTDALVDDELDDSPEPTSFEFSRAELAALRQPVVVRSLLIIGVALLVVVWPQRTDRILAGLVGIGLVIVSATSAWSALRRRPRLWPMFASSVAGLAVGLFLLAAPDRSDTFLGRLIGVVIAVAALRDFVRHWRRDEHGRERMWMTSRTVALLALAGLLVAFPAQLVSAVSTIVALGWVAFAVLVVVVSLDPGRPEVTGYAGADQVVLSWLADRPKSLEAREALYAKVLFDGPSTAKRVIRFFTLMIFASVIASMGIITDSTAVVIGAMLIAPLMTPLMGMAVSLAMGWPNRLARSALVAFGGIACTIGIGTLLGLIAPTVIDVATNSQILSRSTPTVLDLIIAIAAGAAGAYGLSRPDVSDSLPGVAIAIALVPPLAAVGISYSQAEWTAGSGALLLFTTNMLAILVVGGLTFVLTGVAPVQRLAANQQRVRTALAAVGAAGAIVVGLLLINGTEVASNVWNESTIEDTVDDWVEDHPDHGVARISVDGDTVSVAIIGPAVDPPRAAELASLLDDRLGRDMTADVRLIVEERDVATSGADE